MGNKIKKQIAHIFLLHSLAGKIDLPFITIFINLHPMAGSWM